MVRKCFGKILDNPTGLAVLDMCNYETDTYVITRVNVPVLHRRKGIGTDLMNQCIYEADLYQVTLVLTIATSGEMTDDQLRKWYEKLGFKKVGEIMRRLPK